MEDHLYALLSAFFGIALVFFTCVFSGCLDGPDRERKIKIRAGDPILRVKTE
jgi:hypothetical protein